MSILGNEGSILFFNSLIHGIDIRPILRMDMPLSEMAVGFAGILVSVHPQMANLPDIGVARKI